jgi:hypothetical protein
MTKRIRRELRAHIMVNDSPCGHDSTGAALEDLIN